VLPDTKRPPTSLPELPVDFAVPPHVPGDLRTPVCAVVFWHPEMPTTTVPEAAVHEDRQAFAAEDEIGFASQRLVPPPARDPVGAENRRELQFGGAIPGGPDRGHDLSALLLCEHIGHREIRSTKMAT